MPLGVTVRRRFTLGAQSCRSHIAPTQKRACETQNARKIMGVATGRHFTFRSQLPFLSRLSRDRRLWAVLSLRDMPLKIDGRLNGVAIAFGQKIL
jgi:hypothetical protein